MRHSSHLAVLLLVAVPATSGAAPASSATAVPRLAPVQQTTRATPLYDRFPANPEVLTVGTSAGEYGDIAAAIEAADDGDIIRVRPGAYASFAVDGKALTITALRGPVDISGTVRVRHLTPGQTTLLSGLRMTGADSRAFVAHDNVGTVLLQDCEMRGAQYLMTVPNSVGQYFAFDGGWILNSSHVVFSNCLGIGGSAPYIAETLTHPSGSSGGHGLLVQNSDVAFYNCTFQGGEGSGYEQHDGNDGGSGISASGSFLFASGSSATGADGGDGGSSSSDCNYGYGGFGGNGGHGIGAFGSTVALLDCTLQGGFPGLAFGGFLCVGTDGGLGLPIAGAVPTLFSGNAAHLSSARLIDDQAPLSLVISADPMLDVTVEASTSTDFLYVPSLAGVQVPAPLHVVYSANAGPTNATGVAFHAAANLPQPPFGSAVVSIQATVTDPVNGMGQLTAPRWTVVLDDLW